MPLKEISIKDATMNPFTTVYSDWLIVSAGTPKKVNMMVAAWGAFGNIWAKPSVTIYVRESRYTKEFLDNNDTFGISVLPASYRKEMNLIGTKSGRNIDKFKATGLTPLFVDGTPVLKEASLPSPPTKPWSSSYPRNLSLILRQKRSGTARVSLT